MDGRSLPKRPLEAADDSREGKRFQPDGFGGVPYNGFTSASSSNATIHNVHSSDPFFVDQTGYGLFHLPTSQSTSSYSGSWSLNESSFSLPMIGNPGIDPHCAGAGSWPCTPVASQDICYGMVRF